VLAGNHQAAPSACDTAVSDVGPDVVTVGRRVVCALLLRVELLD